MLLVSLYLLLLGTESAVLGDLNKWLTKLEEVPSQSSDSNKTDNSTSGPRSVASAQTKPVPR